MEKPESFQTAATSMSWSPDNKKLCVTRFDRQLFFYNENCGKWDQVQTRGIDHTKPSKDYAPMCQSHSFDAQYIAIGQSDMVVYVFNVGKSLEKKAIQGRYVLQSPATSICWMQNQDSPIQCDILVGCQDGSAYICNMAKKQTLNLFSFQCFTQLLQQKQVAPDGQPSQSGQPIIQIHKISATQAIFVNENGISALFDLNQPNVLRMVSRHQNTITTSAMLFPRNSPTKQFLIIADVQQKVVVNSVDTGQALASIQIRSQGIFTAAAGNPSGNGVLLAGQSGLQYISLTSVSPFVVVHDPQSSLELTSAGQEPMMAVTSICWRPDSAVINVAYTDGAIDTVVPSLSTFTYCGVEISNVAPNKSQLKLKNFSSKVNNFPPGTLEVSLQNSAEVQKIKAYPKQIFTESARSGDWNKPGLYLTAFGERSVGIYSFETDILSEIPIQMSANDKLYFDVGVRRVVVQANMQLGEFTVIYLPSIKSQVAITFTSIRQCSHATQSLISCSPQLDTRKSMVVAHLGEDRQEFVISELSPPEDADDFTEPMSVLARVKHTRIIDWIDISPTGKYVLIRDVSGAIMIFVIESSQVIDLSPSLGNGMVLWASPFDVIVAQEGSDMPILAYYNPGDIEDKPALLNVPTDNQGWTLSSIDASQVSITGQRTSAALFAVVQRQSDQKSLSIPLDQDLLLFNMLMQTKEVTGACILLTKSDCKNKNQWIRLCQAALDQHQFMVCSRCYAALGELGLSKYARSIHQNMKNMRQKFESDFQYQTYCDAQIYLLKGDLDTHDKLLQQCGHVREAIDTYRELHLHHRAESIAPEAEKEQLHAEAIDWLIQTKQSTLAAQLKAQRGDFRGALELLMNDKAYLSAYELTIKILAKQPDSLSQNVVEALSSNLEQAKHYLQAANLVRDPPIRDAMRALSLYRRGGQYQEAITLARTTQPNECVFIEKEWADQLQTTGHFDQAVPHYIEARETRKAVDCALKAGNYDAAERLLLETNVENSLELCLRLAEAKYLQGETDKAVEWFYKADQQLLAVAALSSVGRFDDAVKYVVKNFPSSNAGEVILQEARRLIKIEEKKQYVPPASGLGGVSAALIIQKMESMSSVHGVLAARDLLSAAGMHEQAIEVLSAYKMWDELVSYSRDHKTSNYIDVLSKVADYKKEKGDTRGCGLLLAELAYELFKMNQGKESTVTLKKILGDATKIFNELNMFDESMQLCKRCNDTECLVTVAIQWIQSQPSQFQTVVTMLIKLQRLEQTMMKAIEMQTFDIAMQLAENASNPEEAKKNVWHRQGMLFERSLKLQEAEHAYAMAGKPEESLHMYIDNKRWVEAENVVNNMPMGDQKDRSIRLIKEGRARALVDESKMKEAEQLYIEMNQIDEMVKHYKAKQMFQEALRLAKQFDRRDLIIEISEGFAEKDKKQALNQPVNQDSLSTVNQKQKAQGQINVKQGTEKIVGLKGQMVEACKQGGEHYLEFILSRASEISQEVLKKKISDSFIADDVAIMSSIIQFSEQTIEEKAVMIAVTYMTKGVPNNIVNEKDQSKATISPLMIPGANQQHLLAICKAVLGIEFTEEDYQKRILGPELTHDGFYSKCKTMLLNYRTALLSTQKGQQAFQNNKALPIPGDQELSKCFDALHLMIQSAYTCSQGNNPQQLKEKCQVLSSIVRYCDVVPVDRCFAMAGVMCKKFFVSLQNETSPQAVSLKKMYGGQAFVFLNRLMDILDLQPGQSTGDLDAGDIKNTGIPWNVNAPTLKYLNEKSVEDVRGFVMSLSVQNSDTDQELPREQCPHGCGTERWQGAVACVKCKNTSPICAVTGQHVINHHLKTIPSQPACNVCGCFARPAPWNTYVQKTKNCPVCGELGNPMSK